MIELQTVGELACPIVVCDSCGQAIRGQGAGFVLWHWGSPAKLRFAHKRYVDPRCDPLDDEHWPCSEELDAFLANLVSNTGRAPVGGVRAVRPWGDATG